MTKEGTVTLQPEISLQKVRISKDSHNTIEADICSTHAL